MGFCESLKDVIIPHDSADKEAVEVLARRLGEETGPITSPDPIAGRGSEISLAIG
jgi:hypothetical protein